MQNNGIKLSSKMIIIIVSLITITVAASIYITLYFGNQMASETIEKKLNNSQLIQEEFKEQKLRQLELISQVVASDPAFVAYVAQTIYDIENTEQADVASITDLLLERKQQYGFDLAIIASSDGQQIARSDQTMSVPKSLNNIGLMKNAIQQLVPISGYWSDQDGIYQAAIVPLARGRNLIGFLITGVIINDEFASDIAQLSSTDVMILNQDSTGVSSIASTFDINTAADLVSQLNTIETTAQKQFNLTIDTNELALIKDELIDDMGQKIQIINGVSVDQTLLPFVKTRNILLMAGVIIIAISWLIAKLLVNQSLSQLSKISKAANQVALGNYDAKFPHKVGKDLANLSGSIHHLVQNLRGRDALSKHMIELSKKSQHVVDDLEKTQKVNIEPGQVINNRFKIIKNIGIGGMGAVFQAFDKELDEVVALKLLKTLNAQADDINQFKDEIKVARRISHPNVVRIHDLGQIANNVYISMEYVQGYTLEQILKYSTKLRPLAAKHAAIHICEGLHAAHQSGVIHKDLKPANIIVELDASIKLMDFGIASIDNVIKGNRSNDTVSGTFGYIAPELALGKGADERTDIYALGVLLMEMFIGQRPFYAATDEELMLKHVNEDPLPISYQWEDAPKELENLISKCLAKQPKLRPQSVLSVLNVLKRI